jgi:hypothetical protein
LTATAAASPTPAATAAASPSTPSKAAAPAAARALFGFVHSQLTAVECRAVHLLHRFLGILLSPHCDEAEAARLPGLSVGDNVNVRHLAVLGECGPKRVLARGKGKIAYIKTIAHGLFPIRMMCRTCGESATHTLVAFRPKGRNREGVFVQVSA